MSSGPGLVPVPGNDANEAARRVPDLGGRDPWSSPPPAHVYNVFDEYDNYYFYGGQDRNIDGEPVMHCEIKYLDRRYDNAGREYFMDRQTIADADCVISQRRPWPQYACCVIRLFDRDGHLCEEEDGPDEVLHVHAPALATLLRDVLGDAHLHLAGRGGVRIAAPYHALFHRLETLGDVGRARFCDLEPDDEHVAQLGLLLGWAERHFELELAAKRGCVDGGLFRSSAVAYEHLWTIFPPGSLVVTAVGDPGCRASQVLSVAYGADERRVPSLVLQVAFTDFDGERIGRRYETLCIPKYDGGKRPADLNVISLDLDARANELRWNLLERGKRFQSLCRVSSMDYQGTRIVIDCETFQRFAPKDGFQIRCQEPFALTDEPAGLTDIDLIICNATVRGFNLQTKTFQEFFVDHIKPIEWNDQCFDHLVLDPTTKDTIRTLVFVHSEKLNILEDTIEGKERGLVFLLHGPTGVGKTLTVECVAEHFRLSLYKVSLGELTPSGAELDGAHLERALGRIMDMTSKWDTVLLLDEDVVDIFLNQRSANGVRRNTMTAVLLRLLEHYDGILFLITNQIHNLDEALKSRIDMPVRYTELNFASRLQIWTNFCRGLPGGADVDEAGLQTLAKHRLDGRQIRNIVKNAEALAAYDDVNLGLAQLQQGIDIQAKFEEDLASVRGNSRSMSYYV
ncbi:P-loop containing nucleoside triphosphate hydrolase protein [Xylariaceae sp. FL0804]|nr:P-loop containing nucleoside triphosphate hydrolase protein [Xylariaceae sp. FL0804]